MDNNEQAQTPNTQGAGSEINYEQEYKKILAELETTKQEVEKQKKMKDTYASENNAYKQKERERLSDDEKKELQLSELIASKEQMEAELRTMKLEKEIMGAGFSSEECEKLVKGNFAPKDIADIIKERVENATKSALASYTKDSAPNAPMGNGTTTAKSKSDFAIRQEQLAKASTKGEVKF